MLCRWAHAGLLALAIACLASRARADTDCTPESGISPCLDADTLWLPAGPTRFLAIPSAARPAARFSGGLALSYLTRPVVVTAPSPDPRGREIDVLRSVWTVTGLWSQRIERRISIEAAVPITVSQSGTGVAGITSQSGPSVARNALRDPRLALHSTWLEAGLFDAASRLTLSLPIGAQHDLAGARSAVLAPTIDLGLETGIFFAQSEIGLRLRQPVEIAGSRLGSELVTALGAGVAPSRWLSFALEAWILPSLIAQPGRDVVLVPAEWLASLRAAFPCGVSLQAGAGSGIPLSSRLGPDGQPEAFAAVGTPALRLMTAVRYAPQR